MNDPIIFTPSEVTQLILSVAGFIVAVNAAIAVLISWLNKARKPEAVQNERIDSLEKAVNDLNNEINAIKSDYVESREELSAIETDSKKFQRVMVKSLQALTEHAINGNNRDQLKGAIQALNDYLVDK